MWLETDPARPTLSVVVACRNEARTICGLLRSLDAQQRALRGCEGFDFEVIFADGASEDGTRALLEDYAVTRPHVRILDNPRCSASTGLNTAIKASAGTVIVRMDAHSIYAPDYIAACLAVLEREHAASVGGAVRPAADNYWQRVTAAAHRTKFFSGGSRVYDLAYEGPVESVPYGCWPRQVLETTGLFDENMERNQDDELSLRIRQMGGVIWQSPAIRSWYYPRSTPWGLAKQFFGYGLWKAFTMRKHRTVVSARHLVPAAAVATGAGLLLASFLSRRARRLFAIASLSYAAAVLWVSSSVAREQRSPRLLPGMLAIFPAAHIAYGSGTLAGLLQSFGSKKKSRG